MPTVTPPGHDPFDTESIRHATLQSWRLSGTRLDEDSAAEVELVEIGYRDRLLTELAANAADANTADAPGELAVWLDTAGALHVANTGAPLSADGVASLAALRVSAKRVAPESDSSSRSVGRFGVGFNAVASVGVEVAIRSRTGGVVFGVDRTRAALAEAGVVVSARSAGHVPMLRLPWPDATPPAEGFDTEVVVTLRGDVDAARLLETMTRDVTTLLLELPALQSISVGGDERRRVTTTPADDVDTLAIGDRTWTQVRGPHARWLMPGTAQRPDPVDTDVLHAPTRTDFALSLPAVCIADVAVTPDRRGLHPDADITTAAVGYHRLALALDPVQRLSVIPRPGFPASRVDGVLRDAVLADLTTSRWLPTADAALVAPDRAVVVADITHELAVILADLIDGVVDADLCDPASLRLLASVGVTEMTLVEVCERLSGITRPPRWWHDLYEALAPMVTDDRVRGEIATIPVPRADGRMSIGARDLVLADLGAGPDTDTDTDDTPGVSWVATVHPAAEHPLLERLGAQRMSVTELLAEPALRAAITDSHEADPVDIDGVDIIGDLAAQVLTLVAADPHAVVPDWLGQLLLPATEPAEPTGPTDATDTDGTDESDDLRPADELLLPGSPIASILVSDAPFGLVDAAFVDRFGAEALRRIGVGWGFTVITDDLPAGPDHDLPDESTWWDSLADEPQHLVAVRDLDLVDPDRWPEALSLLAGDETVAATLGDRGGYTAWWLRTFAEIGGRPLGWYRAPDDATFAGILDPLDHPAADRIAGALAGSEITSLGLAELLLQRLADPDRVIAPGVVAGTHAALVRAHRRGVLDLERLDAPDRVRTLAGTTSQTAVVVDQPWVLQILDAHDAVVLPPPISTDDAARLALILDIATAGEDIAVTVVEPGDPSTWTDSPVALAFALRTGINPPGGEVRLHDALRLDVHRGGDTRRVEVDWWVDDAGIHHLRRPDRQE